MKIALLTNNFQEPWAEGGKNNVRQVAARLRQSHEVFVTGLGPKTCVLQVDDMEVHNFKSPGYHSRFARVGYLYGYLSFVSRARALLREKRPDVVFSYFETASTAFFSSWLRRAAAPDAPLMHTVWSDYYTSASIPFAHWFTELLPQRLLNGRTASRIGIRHVDRVLVTSRYLGEQVTKLGRESGFTPTGVDTVRFTPPPERDVPAKTEPLRIGYVGHLTYTKGVSLLLEALEHILDLEPQLHLVLAVTESAEESGMVERLKHPRIEVLGMVDTAEVFRSLDLTVLPRRYSYGTCSYPNVVLESMACGTPVLTARLPAIDELIEDGVNGFLFAPNDLTDLRSRLLSIIRDPSVLGDAGVKARARAEELGWDVVTPAVLREVEACALKT